MSKEKGVIEQGDTVYLKSGSPRMKVIDTDLLSSNVSWDDGSGHQEMGVYPTAALSHDNNAEWIKKMNKA